MRANVRNLWLSPSTRLPESPLHAAPRLHTNHPRLLAAAASVSPPFATLLATARLTKVAMSPHFHHAQHALIAALPRALARSEGNWLGARSQSTTQGSPHLRLAIRLVPAARAEAVVALCIPSAVEVARAAADTPATGALRTQVETPPSRVALSSTFAAFLPTCS